MVENYRTPPKFTRTHHGFHDHMRIKWAIGSNSGPRDHQRVVCSLCLTRVGQGGSMSKRRCGNGARSAIGMLCCRRRAVSFGALNRLHALFSKSLNAFSAVGCGDKDGGWGSDSCRRGLLLLPFNYMLLTLH